MFINLNAEQTQVLARILPDHDGESLDIESGSEHGVSAASRTLTFSRAGEPTARYIVDVMGRVDPLVEV